MGVLRFARTVKVKGPPERVWPLVANNDLLNREMGLPLPKFSFKPAEGGGTETQGEVALGPLTLTYEEHPFEWIRPHRYAVKRVFLNGPFRVITGEVTLQEVDHDTDVATHVEIETRLGGTLAARAFAFDAMRRFEQACQGFSAFLSSQAPTAYPKESSRPPADGGRLASLIGELRKMRIPEDSLSGLATFLRDAPAAETVLFRPSKLATRLGVSVGEALELCLVATEAGILDLSWRVMCPYCGGNRQVLEHLSELSASVHCESCAIRFDSQFDENVEVLFSVAHSIRPVVRAAYCIGGPHLAPQVVAQLVLRPGEVRSVNPTLPPGRYRLLSRQADRPAIAVASDGLIVSLGLEGFMANPGSEWVVHNRLNRPAVVRIEETEGREEVTTAAQITTMAAFRDRFSAEVLSPGTELAVRQVCLIFTDLKESTRMYREKGDAPSYAAVRGHFERLAEAVSTNNGTIVKTIGDAVMAAFHDPADGIRAAFAMLRREQDLVTKIGVHAGPAIVVNANGVLDYFGRTVNLAARLQKFSEGGDVVITRELAADPHVAALLAGVKTESFCADVRGVAEDVPMIRCWP